MRATVADPMYETDVMFMMFQIVFALMALYFAGIGCAVLVRRKPLIISSGWSVGFFLLLLAPKKEQVSLMPEIAKG